MDSYSESYIRSQSQVLRTPTYGETPTGLFDLNSCYVYNDYTLKPLTSISYKDISITYIYSNKPSAGSGKKLDRIQIKHNNDLIKNIPFTYTFNAANRMFLNKIEDEPSSGPKELIGAFEYTNHTQLPAIGSFAKDHFGYYNGRLNNKLIPQGSYTTPFYMDNGRAMIVNYNGADRKLNESVVRTGMLSRITYPGKGYTTFSYEPNMAYYGQNEQEVNTIYFNAYTDHTISGWQTKYSNSFEITSGTFTFKSLMVDNFDGVDPNATWQKPVVKLVNLQGTVYRTLQGNVFGENLSSDIVVNNLPQQTYRIRVELYNHSNYEIGCTVRGEYTTDRFIRNKYYGGLRVGSITNYSKSGQIAAKRDFEYQDFSNSNNSSGKVFGKYTSYEDIVTVISIIGDGTAQDFKKLISNGLQSLAYNHNSAVLYEQVKEIFQGDNESYEIKRFYKNYGANLWSLSLPNPEGSLIVPYSLENYANGMLWRKEYLDNSGKKVKSSENDYQFIIDGNNDVVGYVYSCDRSTPQKATCNVMEYSIPSRWFVNTSAVDTTFYGNQRFITATANFYENPLHKQLTKTETTNSNGDKIINKTIYPQDLTTKTPAEQELIDQYRIATPIEVISSEQTGTNPEDIISKVRNHYKDWGNGIVEIEKVRTAKASLSSVDLEDRIEYLDYDNQGNPLEVSKSDGSHILYIWGYNNQYPIAKIDHATYTGMPTEVTNLINQIKTATHTEDSVAEENTIRGLFANLRQQAYFQDSEITSYTYDPLIGVTSVTDPKGYTMYYTYDDMNRLQFVKDADGHLISENKYHYKK